MEVEILKIVRNENSESIKLADVEAEVKRRMKLWFTILKNKKGYPFCVPTKAKVQDEWLPAFQLSDELHMKRLCNEVLKKTLEKEAF